MVSLINIFSDYTLRTVALGSALLGAMSGVIGTYAVLRKQSLVGDAVSHAALPGIGIAFLLTGSKNIEWLLLGAFISGWLSIYIVNIIIKHSRVKYDSALGMMLSVFFGLGLVILTYIQKIPDSNQAGLEGFLFGQASTLLKRDVIVMSIVGGAIIIIVALLWKEFKLLSFDPEFCQVSGFPKEKLDLILTTLIVIAIVTGLQTVGVVLMSAMIIAPAVAARQWTDKLSVMVILSSVFGGLSGVIGTIISSSTRNLPTGPVIVVIISAISIISLFIAPGRGIIWRRMRDKKNKKRLNRNIILNNIYNLSTEGNGTQGYSLEDLSISKGDFNFPINTLEKELENLETLDLVKVKDKKWYITEKGINEIEDFRGGLGE
ncbi:metal ABC transporter permease [Anaerosalibacter bizertensis]|uniref:Metal ABC transporter permease n=1 Tax=Anaerosalibacter bizertensis TaxID=932217 RepID=A0A844FGG0_9FIRM|nr:metal ABC transporter permease [Anaerosalibacter bizertensis]